MRLVDRLSKPSSQDRADVRQSIHGFFVENFHNESSGYGEWEALKPRTQEERGRLGYDPDHPILRREGTYMMSFLSGADHVGEFARSNDGWSIVEGSKDERVLDLEYGNLIMADRPVTVPNERSYNHILATLDRIVDRAEREVGV